MRTGRLIGLLLLSGALHASAAPPVAAQSSSPRDGLWYGFTLPVGWSRVTCEICNGDLALGFAGAGRVGTTINESMLIGFEANAWRETQEDVTRLMAAAGVVAYWYPNPAESLFLKGGLGVLTFRATDDEATLTSTNLGAQVGLGYDLRVGRGLSITPSLNMVVTLPPGELSAEGEQVVGGVRLYLIQAGFGVTWH